MDPAAQELITRHNEQVRELIVRDIDALSGKLDVKAQVSRRKDEAMDKLKGTLGMNHSDPGESLTGFARHNAVPLAAIALGGAILARNARARAASSDTQSTTTRLVTESSYVPDASNDSRVDEAKAKVSEVADSARATASDVAAKASDVADTAKAKVTDVKDSVLDGASSAKVTVSTQAVHAKEVVVEHVPSRQQASQMATDHYTLVGLAALGAGAALGTFMPRTQFEERKLAPVQDKVKDRAGELVEGGVEKARETADRAADALSAAAETAKDEFAEAGDDTDEPPSTDLPDLTRPNRITGSRGTSPNGMPTTSGGGTSGSY